MTKKLKIPKIARYLFYGLALFMYTNCSVEEDLIEQSNGIIHRKINFEEIKKDNIIMDNLTNYSKFMKQSSLKQKSTDSLVVDISFANYIETDEFISYTFNMPTSSVPLRNFLLKKQKNSTGGFHGYVLNYNLTQEELNSLNTLNLCDLSNKVTSVKVGSNFSAAMFGKKNQNKSSNTCYGWVGICHLAWGGGMDVSGHVASSNQCQVSTYQFQAFECPDVGGGNYQGPDLSNPPPPLEPPPHQGTSGGIIVSPTRSGTSMLPPLVLTEYAECESLKNLLEFGKQNIKPIINQLKQKLIANVKNEWGASHEVNNVYDPISNTNNLTYSNSPLIEGNPVSVKVTIGNKHTGSTHSHPKDGYPIFSWQDLRLLRNTFQIYAELFQYMVSIQIVCYNKADPSNPLIYSLKVKDFTKLNNKIEADWTHTDLNGKSEKQKLDIIHEKLAKKYDANKNNLELFFLQYFKDYGVELYKANNELNNWTKLSLNMTNVNPNGELKQTPCF